MQSKERFYGSMLGLAAGDALGTTLEFKRPGSFEPITDMVGGGPFDLEPGCWTDDTSMALCLAESLIQCKGFDPQDQLKRYLRWMQEEYYSSTGVCFDIGNTVSMALRKFEVSGQPWCGSPEPHTAGNGSIMRLAPVPLYFANDPIVAIEMSAQSSRTTHGAEEAVDGCRLLAALIIGALKGEDKTTLLSHQYHPTGGWGQPMTAKIKDISVGCYKTKNPPEIRGTGYVVDSLEAALWAFYHSQDFAHGALLAVNLGDDADTTGAVYGQLAGAYYGESGIPQSWLEKLVMKQEIIDLALGLMERKWANE